MPCMVGKKDTEICLSTETKELIKDRKDDDETYDHYLRRLMGDINR